MHHETLPAPELRFAVYLLDDDLRLADGHPAPYATFAESEAN